MEITGFMTNLWWNVLQLLGRNISFDLHVINISPVVFILSEIFIRRLRSRLYSYSSLPFLNQRIFVPSYSFGFTRYLSIVPNTLVVCYSVIAKRVYTSFWHTILVSSVLFLNFPFHPFYPKIWQKACVYNHRRKIPLFTPNSPNTEKKGWSPSSLHQHVFILPPGVTRMTMNKFSVALNWYVCTVAGARLINVLLRKIRIALLREYS